MTQSDDFDLTIGANQSTNHPEWEGSIVCRVEVDLPGWLAQLTGRKHWEVYSEAEEENCISFSLRQAEKAKEKTKHAKTLPDSAEKLAEVTLYHNGYAVVDVDGKALFDGSLTTGNSHWAHLSYFNAENGEPITLN